MASNVEKLDATQGGNPLQELDDILGSTLVPLLQALPDAKVRVEQKLKENAALFERKAAVPPGQDMHAVLMEKIARMETHVAKRYAVDMQKKESIECLAASIFSFTGQHRRGLFLKESSARSLLQRHPPERLTEAVHKGSLDSRAVLALTRHTETDEWQHAYQALITSLTSEDFEERELSYQVIDQDLYGSILHTHRWKPWLISHNKETGIINCFTYQNPGFSAPLLQFISVFMHYIEETASAGIFFTQAATHTPGRFGERISASITNTSDMFGYFQPHVYSETLFWKRAGMRLFALVPTPEAKFFSEVFDCGSDTLSLNFVDLLWDINLSHNRDAAEYFGERSAYFTYHFREALWYEIFRELLSMDHESFGKAVIAELDKGDWTFTKKLIAATFGKNI